MRSARPFLALLLATLPVAPGLAQDQAAPPPLPRVIYGAPDPSVIYGPPSAEPARRAPAAPPPPATQPAPPPAQSQGSLTYGWGPLYVPPPGSWGPPPHRDRPPRPLPPVSVPGARGGYYEPPQPPGTYIGRPPSAPGPRWGFERSRR